jgi:polysaccharide transporter, PST family
LTAQWGEVDITIQSKGTLKLAKLRLRATLNGPNVKRIFGNAAALFVLQGLNYILPLITTPYLIRVIGGEKFGVLAFTSSFVGYFHLLVIYGFNLSAVRSVSQHRLDKHYLGQILSAVFGLRIAIGFLAFVVMILLVLLIPFFRKDLILYFWAYIAGVGGLFVPIWFFQGMEKMGYITAIDLLAKILTLVSYFLFIHSPQHFLRVFYIGCCGSWVMVFTSLIIIGASFKIKFLVPSGSFYAQCLKDGYRIFVSQFSGAFFTNSNTFVLGLFSTSKIVGTYAIAEKIVRAAITLSVPVCSAIYPHSSYLFKQSMGQGLRFIRKVFIVGGLLFALGSALLFLSADFLVLIVSGERNPVISGLIRLLSILPLCVFLDNLLYAQIMLNCNLEKQYMRAVITTGLLSTGMLLAFVPFLGASGSALSYLFSEVLVLALYWFAIRKAGIKLFG